MLLNQFLSKTGIVLLLQLQLIPNLSAQQGATEALQVAKIKQEVAKRGTGEKAQVKVKLRDKTEVRGFIYQIREDSFIVRNAKTGADRAISYSDVKDVTGKGLSTGAKIGIGVAIGVGVLAAIAAYIGTHLFQ
jgi:hypothetical protein